MEVYTAKKIISCFVFVVFGLPLGILSAALAFPAYVLFYLCVGIGAWCKIIKTMFNSFNETINKYINGNNGES